MSGAPSGSTLSVEAAEFVPSQANYSLANGNHLTNGAFDAVSITEDAVHKLLSNPESFFEVVNPLTENLFFMVTSSAILQNVVEQLFQKCIFHSNFQYNGARLCTTLTRNLKLSFEQGDFRRLLLNRCMEEYNKREELSKSKEGLEELAGFTLFFAEFMLQLNIPGLLSDVFAPCLFDLMLLLLSTPDGDALKCVNKVLKLTGSALEKANTLRMNDIFNRIKEVIVKPETSREMRGALLRLVALRAQNWSPDGTPAVNGVSEQYQEEPEFRDINGEVVYEDYEGETDYGGYAEYFPEQYAPEDFNEENYEDWVPEENGEYDEIPVVIGNDEMDPEMDEAYEQFLAQLNPPAGNS